jgi:ribosomal protein S18 acetylase RimI-like enzyme
MSDAPSVAVRPAAVPDEMGLVRALFLEYGRSLSFDLCFQGFEQELADLPGCYAAPRGQILLAPGAGVVALRPLSGDICEMKRLYVRPQARGLGLGARLAHLIIAAGQERGYRAMRLDTHESMTAAIALYRELGFREIAPYYDNPVAGIRYYELTLAAATRSGFVQDRKQI